MPHEFIAGIFWSVLGASVVLTIVALTIRSWRLLLLAAGLAIVFAVAAIFSIGVIILLAAIVQVVLALVLRHLERGREPNVQ